MRSIEINGTPSGDGECFCWNVTEEEYRRVLGDKRWQLERSCRDDEPQMYANEPWRIYPGDLLNQLNYHGTRFVITSLEEGEEFPT